MSFVNNLLQGGQQLFSQAGNAVGNIMRPPIVSPLPQQPQQSQPNPVANILSGAWNMANSPITAGGIGGNQVRDIPQLPPVPQQYANRPVTGGLLQLGRGAANMGVNIANTVLGQGIVRPLTDVSTLLNRDITGKPLPQYNDLQSPQVRTAYNIMGDHATPQQIIGNAAGDINPVISAYGGGKVFGLGKDIAMENAGKGFVQSLLSGAKMGSVFGAAQSGLQSLQDNRNGSLSSQLGQGAMGAGQGAVYGALLGAVTSGATYLPEAVRQLTAKSVMNQNPGISANEALTTGDGFLRNELGQFMGGNKKTTPFYTDPLLTDAKVKAMRKELGLPIEGNYNQGFIDLNAKVGNNNLPWETPESMQSAEYKDTGQLPNSEPVSAPKSPSTINPESAINPKDIAREGRYAHFAATQSVIDRTNTLAERMKDTLITPQDNLNFRLAVENPAKLEEYAGKSQNPQAFTQLAKQYSAYTDAVLNQKLSSGGKMNAINDYFTHIWDLTDRKSQNIFSQLMQTKSGNPSPPWTKQRFYSTFQEGMDKGLKLKNPYAFQDVMQYGSSMAKHIAAESSNQVMNKLAPGTALTLKDVDSVPIAQESGQYKQSNLPMNGGTFIHPDVQKYMGFYDKSAFADNKVVHIADKVNQFVKFWDLGLGGFHALKTTARQFINDPRIIPRAIANAVNPESRLIFHEQAVADGTIDGGSRIGVTFGQNNDILNTGQSIGDVLKNSNPLNNFNKSLFGGLIDTYKVNVTRGILNKYDLNDPVQLEQARALGAQVNNLFGGLNYEVLNRNKTIQQLTRFAVLAPDFNEGKIRQVAQAANPLNYASAVKRPAAMFAMKNIVGEAVVMGSLALIGQRLLTGKFDTSFKNILTQAINPSIPLPNSPNFNNPKTGKQQTVNLPGNDITDIVRAGQNPNNFIQGRASAAVSTVDKLLSGKDYYDRPLVDPFSGKPDNLVNRAIAIGKNTLPIPGVQLAQVAQGKQTVPNAIINTLGGRVVNNPNTPQAQATTNYFNSLNQYKQSLNPNEQAVFGLLHPITKDADGNPVVDKNILTSPDKYETLLANPKVLSAEQKFQQSQPSHDPLWDLNSTQLQAYMHAIVISKNNPISGFGSNNPQAQTVKTLYAMLPPNFFAQRQAFFSSLPSSGQLPNQQPQAPQMPSQISQFWAQYAQLPSGTGQRTKALMTPLGQQALAFINTQQQFTNAQRADMGLPLLTPQSSSSSSGGGSGGGGMSARQKYLRRTAFSNARYTVKNDFRKLKSTIHSYKPVSLRPKKMNTMGLTAPHLSVGSLLSGNPKPIKATKFPKISNFKSRKRKPVSFV